MANRGPFLRVNEYLGPLDWLASPNGQFFTMMQRDGNLVVYPGSPEAPGGEGLWAYSDFAREDDDYFAVMQRDGNLCVYRGTGPNDNRGNVWCTRPEALEQSDDYILFMQNDGNLCVYKGFPGSATYVWGWMGLRSSEGSVWDKIREGIDETLSVVSGEAAYKAIFGTDIQLPPDVANGGDEGWISGANQIRDRLLRP